MVLKVHYGFVFCIIALRLVAFDSNPVDQNIPFSSSPDQSRINMFPQFPIFYYTQDYGDENVWLLTAAAILACSYSLYFQSLCLLSIETIRTCVDQCGSASWLYTASAQFLCVLFSEEAKKRGTSAEKSASLSAALNSESGEKLCELLLEVKLSGSLK